MAIEGIAAPRRRSRRRTSLPRLLAHAGRLAAMAGIGATALGAIVIMIEPNPVVARMLFAEEAADDSSRLNKESGLDKICRTVERVSAENDLPVEFFTRLIWQESGFETKLVSRKGARGIAQFMPATAIERGLKNPFEPLQALKESASYLRELFITFGNLGLAAAAYNAGPARISRWLAGKAHLPDETSSYVQIVTGHAVTEWASPNPPRWEGATIPKGVPCDQLDTLIAARSEEAKAPDRATSEQTTPGSPATPEETRAAPAETLKEANATPPASPSQPTPPANSSDASAGGPPTWGVQLAGSWEEGKVLASFERIRRQFSEIIGDHRPLVLKQQTPMGHATRYVLRISETSRQSAEALCDQLRAANGACLVLANPRD